MAPDPKLLDEIVRRIVDCVHPSRIILFGSAARGEMGAHSDLDLMVVMPGEVSCRELSWRISSALGDLDHAKEVLVFRESDVAEYGDNPYLVVHTALATGKELYHADR